MAEVRDEKTQWRRLDSANETRTSTRQTTAASNAAHFDGSCAFSLAQRTTTGRHKQETNARPLITSSTSHKHGRTTHNNFGSLGAKSTDPDVARGRNRPSHAKWHLLARPLPRLSTFTARLGDTGDNLGINRAGMRSGASSVVCAQPRGLCLLATKYADFAAKRAK